MSRIVRAPDLLGRRGWGVVVAARPGAPAPSAVTDAGAEVWDLFDQPRGLDELVAAAAARVGQDPDEVRAGLLSLIEDLEEQGVLRRVP